MRGRFLALGLAALLAACGANDLHRLAGIPQGTLVVGLGMPMREVARRSTVKLHKLPTLGLPTGTYADGNAYFDFELAGSSLRFRGCSMYSIDFEGPDETVKSLSVYVTPHRHRWRALQRELRETAAKLKGDGWEPYQHDGWPSLESFLAQDPSGIGTTTSGVVGTFDWRKREILFRVSAHRAWDGPQFWSSFNLSPASALGVVLPGQPPAAVDETMRHGVWWPPEFPLYPGALGLCSRNTPQSVERKPGQPAWAMFGTGDEPADVLAFYASERGVNPEPGATTLRLESKDGKKHLRVYPIGGGYSEDCGVRPTSWAKTILIPSEAQEAAPRKDWLSEFPSYPGASEVCSGHVLGSSKGERREIAFSLYSTKDEPAAVVGFYASARQIEPERGATTLTVRSADGKAALSVHPVSGSYPDCGAKPSKDAKAIIVLSQLTP